MKSTKNVNSTEEFALEKNKRNAGIVGSGRNGIVATEVKTNSKDKVQEVDADGVPIIGEDNRYNAAENWLKDIREKRKKEDFFKGKVDTASVTPIK